MKYFASILVVLALVVPALAQEPITITATVEGDAITLGYDATGAAAMPAAFSFIVDCGDGAVVTAGDVGLADAFFDVFIDYAADDPAAYQAGADPATGVFPNAHPLAKTDAAGATLFPASVFSISAAELANIDTIPAIGTICTLKITGTGTVCFSEDALRGGVVDVNGNPMVVTLPDCTFPPPPDCLYVGGVFNYTGPGPAISLTITQAIYDRWVTLGKPACWCCLAQKAGNIVTTNLNVMVNSADLNAIRMSWLKCIGQSGYNPCADLNLSGCVNSGDLTVLRTHWLMNVGTCTWIGF